MDGAVARDARHGRQFGRLDTNTKMRLAAFWVSGMAAVRFAFVNDLKDLSIKALLQRRADFCCLIHNIDRSPLQFVPN